jgi:CHASE3 domain sensor protein
LIECSHKRPAPRAAALGRCYNPQRAAMAASGHGQTFHLYCVRMCACKEGTIKTIRKVALQVGAAALLAILFLNAYLEISHLKQMQKSAALTLEGSTIQSDISGILQDFTNMETGQRGYLLTGNSSYLQPYADAKAKIGADLARLRERLANRVADERSMESQLESLANSKQDEMERSIAFRQKGYRHRAFMLEDTNEGQEYMDKARGLLASLSAAESGSLATSENARNATLKKTLEATIIANLCLVLLTAGLFALGRFHGQALEREAAESKRRLAERDFRLGKLTFALSNNLRSETSAIEANVSLLLGEYGGFLPRMGHECAEQIKESALQMDRLQQELVGTPKPEDDEKAA